MAHYQLAGVCSVFVITNPFWWHGFVSGGKLRERGEGPPKKELGAKASGHTQTKIKTHT